MARAAGGSVLSPSHAGAAAAADQMSPTGRRDSDSDSDRRRELRVRVSRRRGSDLRVRVGHWQRSLDSRWFTGRIRLSDLEGEEPLPHRLAGTGADTGQPGRPESAAQVVSRGRPVSGSSGPWRCRLASSLGPLQSPSRPKAGRCRRRPANRPARRADRLLSHAGPGRRQRPAWRRPSPGIRHSARAARPCPSSPAWTQVCASHEEPAHRPGPPCPRSIARQLASGEGCTRTPREAWECVPAHGAARAALCTY